MNSPVVFTSEQLTVLNTIYQKYLSGQILVFNPINEDEGYDTVEINALSGTATFTSTIPFNTTDPQILRINNSYITPSSKILFSVYYESVDIDYPLVPIYKSLNGALSFYLINISQQNTVNPIKISFVVLGS
jgi:hypothetical protein